MGIGKCIDTFEKLLDTKYVIHIGRKGKKQEIVLKFSTGDFSHLIGLHKLTDVRQLGGGSKKEYSNLKNNMISGDDLKKSVYYNKIDQFRIKYFPRIIELIESGKVVFKYNKSANLNTTIKFDFVMELKDNLNPLFLFIISDRSEKNLYHPVTFFKKDRMDYTKGQTSWVVLKVEKESISTGTKEVVYLKETYKELFEHS